LKPPPVSSRRRYWNKARKITAEACTGTKGRGGEPPSKDTPAAIPARQI
jgi:hypothetical protein